MLRAARTSPDDFVADLSMGQFSVSTPSYL
jgi:hypothetical protein